jgi:hypothetical protein
MPRMQQAQFRGIALLGVLSATYGNTGNVFLLCDLLDATVPVLVSSLMLIDQCLSSPTSSMAVGRFRSEGSCRHHFRRLPYLQQAFLNTLR